MNRRTILWIAACAALASECAAQGNANESPAAALAAALDDGDLIVARKKTQLKKASDHKRAKTELRAEIGAFGSDPATLRAADFDTRCKRAFYQGQEAAFAACRAEAQQNAALFESVKGREAALNERIKSWDQTQAQIENDGIALDAEYDRWRRRVRALMVVVNAGCTQKDFAASRPAGSATLAAEVSYYRSCFDGGAGGSGPAPVVGSGTNINFR